MTSEISKTKFIAIAPSKISGIESAEMLKCLPPGKLHNVDEIPSCPHSGPTEGYGVCRGSRFVIPDKFCGHCMNDPSFADRVRAALESAKKSKETSTEALTCLPCEDEEPAKAPTQTGKDDKRYEDMNHFARLPEETLFLRVDTQTTEFHMPKDPAHKVTDFLSNGKWRRVIKGKPCCKRSFPLEAGGCA